MDNKAEKKRLAHLESVQRYFATHKGDIRRVSLAWPIPLLKKIDEAVRETGVSRQSWVFRVCEAELARLRKGRKRKAK